MKTFLGRGVLAVLTGLPVAAVLAVGWAVVAFNSPPVAMADPVPFLTAEGRENTVPASWDEPVSGEFTPGTTPAPGPSLAAGSRCAYFEIYAPADNGGVMLYGGTDDAAPLHQLPAGTTRMVYVGQLAEFQFDGFDADDKITFLGYR